MTFKQDVLSGIHGKFMLFQLQKNPKYRIYLVSILESTRKFHHVFKSVEKLQQQSVLLKMSAVVVLLVLVVTADRP